MGPLYDVELMKMLHFSFTFGFTFLFVSFEPFALETSYFVPGCLLFGLARGQKILVYGAS